MGRILSGALSCSIHGIEVSGIIPSLNSVKAFSLQEQCVMVHFVNFSAGLIIQE